MQGTPLTAYIALTRIQDRESLYVYRAFPPEPFQKGAKLGRELLLRHWGGKRWIGKRSEHNTGRKRMCKECHESKPLSAFTAGRWKRTDAAQVCKECVRRHTENGQPWQCMACSSWKEENAFEAKHAKPQATFYRICKSCEETRVCAKCQEWKNETCFSAHAWKRARGGARLCLDCTTKARGLWVCKICCKKQTCAAFQTWLSRHKALNGDQWCDSCKAKTIKPSVRKKAIARLAPRRKKLQQARREKVIEEVWKEILQQNRLGQGHAVQTDVQEEVSLERPGTQDVEVTRPARKLFKYTCPFCFKEVPSNVKTGDVDHRRTCGHRFSVQDGRIRETFEYKCPFCHGTVTSKIVTGQLDHRRTCGNRFYVIDGLVSPADTAIRTRLSCLHHCGLFLERAWTNPGTPHDTAGKSMRAKGLECEEAGKCKKVRHHGKTSFPEGFRNWQAASLEPSSKELVRLPQSQKLPGVISGLANGKPEGL